MFQPPLQTIVAILQLIMTTLQLIFMIFTWFNPKRTQPFVNQRLESAETALAPQQHGRETSPTDIASTAIDLAQQSHSFHDAMSQSSPLSV
ncbi:hypothetical protein F4680DRAFT_424214 [Xylaria scruposa]|nr:hypothetical protein F4680DRAFT_424214 [Xylaria scruposa]